MIESRLVVAISMILKGLRSKTADPASTPVYAYGEHAGGAAGYTAFYRRQGIFEQRVISAAMPDVRQQTFSVTIAAGNADDTMTRPKLSWSAAVRFAPEDRG